MSPMNDTGDSRNAGPVTQVTVYQFDHGAKTVNVTKR